VCVISFPCVFVLEYTSQSQEYIQVLLSFLTYNFFFSSNVNYRLDKMKIMQCGSVMIVVVAKQRIRIQSKSHQYLEISKNDFAKKTGRLYGANQS